MQAILANLQKTRRQRKISQQQLSQKLAIPQSYLSKIESGKVDTRLSNVTDLAHALGFELMLIPRHYVPAIQAILQGKSTARPAFLPDEGGDDER